MHLDFLQDELWGLPLAAYVRFGIILLIAILLKKYLAIVLTKIIFALFKRHSKGRFTEQFKHLMLQPLQGLVVTIFFYIAIYQLSKLFNQIVVFERMKFDGKELVKTNGTIITLMNALDSLFLLLTTFYFFWLITRMLDFLFLVWTKRAEDEGDRQRQQLLPLLSDVLKVVTWVIGVFSVLGAVFHVNVAALVAGLGIGGIALAFAAKDSLENLLASFMVLIDKPFATGDWIKVDGVEGNIEKVGFRSTRIRSFDKSLIILPNKKLIENNLENFSERGTRRVKLTVGAVYGLSRSTLELVMAEMAKLIEGVAHAVGKPTIFVDEFGDYAINIVVVYFLDTKAGYDFFEKKQEVNLGIYEIMYRHAKGFAFPTQVEIAGVDINEVV